MSNKFFIICLALAIVSAGSIFLATSSSYQEALKSRFYYEIGSYEEAHELAKSAYQKDIYNKMAHTVMTQSEISLKYVKFINEAQKYLDEISKISKEDQVSKVQVGKIRVMCEIVIGNYDRLSASAMTAKSLQDEAREMKEKFLKLQNALF